MLAPTLNPSYLLQAFGMQVDTTDEALGFELGNYFQKTYLRV